MEFHVVVLGLSSIDMSHSLEQFIAQIIDATKLRGKVRDRISSELRSHIVEEERELQLQGYSEEKIYSIIVKRFGDPHFIARELRMTHSSFQLKEHWIIVLFTIIGINTFLGFIDFFNSPCTTGIAGCLGGTLASSLLGWIIFIPMTLLVFTFDQFALVFLGLTMVLLLVTALFTYISSSSHLTSFTSRISKALTVLSGGIILQWLSIWTSYRMVGGKDYEGPMATAGFPFKVFDFPYSPMGGDNVPIEMWKPFYINYVIWMVIGVIGYFLLPKKITSHKLFSPAIITISLYLTVYSLGKIVFAFD